MGLFEHFPYTNFHRLNFDWLARKVKDILDRIEQAEEDIDALEVTVDDHAERIGVLEADSVEIWRRILPNVALPLDDDLSEAATSGTATRLGNVLTVNYSVDFLNVNVAHKMYFRNACVIPFGPEDAWSGIPVLSFRDATTGDVLAFPIVRDPVNHRQYFTIPSGTHAGSLFGSLIVQWEEETNS